MEGLFSQGHWRLLAGAAAVTLAAGAVPAMAQQTRTFDVPAGPASQTIPLFAKQAGIQVIGNAETLRSKRTQPVKGRFTVEEALRRLLGGTRLGPTSRANDVITIGLVWRGNDEAAGRGDVVDAGVAEILVIGSRNRNVDVRRTEDDAQPYVVFDREEVASSQATTVEEFLRTRLTQNSGAGGSASQTTGNGQPYSSFNLRGLGANQTLILVNGRRLPSLANQDMTPGQADINGIPMGSIERIEVLPSSAGGIYGGNAVGGVINIVLRSDYKGIDLTATYNDTFDFHAPNGRLDINGGFALEGGRTTVTFGGSISRSGTLRVGDRERLIQDGMDRGFANVSPYGGNGTPPRANGVNIRSTSGSSLTLKPQYGGTDLGSNLTSLPLGYAGVDSDNGAALVAGAGSFNLDMPDDLSGRRRGLLTSPEVESFNVNVRRQFSDTFDVFVDYSRLVNRGLSYSHNQLPTAEFLSADSPNNPFEQAVQVSFPNPNYSFPYRHRSKTDALSVGTIIRLPGKWAVNAEYNKTWSLNSSVYYNAAIDVFGFYCGLQGTNDPFYCTGKPILNPLQSPVDYGPYLFTEPTFIAGPYRSKFDNPSLRASGPLFNMAGGPANLTIAIQQERTTIRSAVNQAVDTFTRDPLYIQFPGRSQRTNSGYAEIVLPFVSPANDISLLRELEIRAAVRHDRYLTKSPPAAFASFVVDDPATPYPTYTNLEARFKSSNFTLAGRYSPFNGVMLRASYATGFLPPSVVQLASSSFLSSGLYTPDPLRGDELIDYSLTVTGGAGNAALRPEKSKSVVIGAVLTPIDGLRFSADYTRISKRDEVGGIPIDFLLANPDLFPGRVVRAAPDAGDPAGFPGRIASIDFSPVNQFRSRFEAVDFQLDYDFETSRAGKFRLYALATWQPKAVRQLLSGETALNYAGNGDGPLKWQGNMGVDWTFGKLGVRWNTQYYNGYNVYSTQDPDTPNGASLIDGAIELQGARRIPSQMYSDLHVSYDFGDAAGALNGVRISAGIQNVFDKKPPVVAIQSYTQAGYSTYGDPRLRRFTISLRKSFGNK